MAASLFDRGLMSGATEAELGGWVSVVDDELDDASLLDQSRLTVLSPDCIFKWESALLSVNIRERLADIEERMDGRKDTPSQPKFTFVYLNRDA